MNTQVKLNNGEIFMLSIFKEKINPSDPELKSFENRIGDFRIRVGVKTILVY